MSDEPMHSDTILAMKALQDLGRQRANFCDICWGPLNECPGHVGYVEMFAPTAIDAEAMRADLEVRERGLRRKQAAMDDAAKGLGFEGIDDLVEQVMP